MTKSNGIASLKQAARLLNKHSPDGESLAYINPEEARVLKARGGSGIMTLAGVPTYGFWSDLGQKALEYAPKIFNYGQKAIDTFNKGKDFIGNLNFTSAYGGENDQRSTGTEYDDSYWQTSGINPNQPMRFDPAQGNIPYEPQENPFLKNLGSSIMKSGKDFLTGRYGGGEGIKNIAKDAASVWMALRAKKDQEGLNNAEMEQFNKLNQQMEEYKTEFQANIAGGGVQNVPTDVSVFSETTGRPDMITTATPAEGGRIGAFNGGIQGLMPQQGFMPQPGLDPRMGYANAGEVENFNWGGPDVVETANMREEALFNNPIFDRDIQALEKEQTGKFEDLVAQEENKKRSDIQMRLNKYRELVDVEATGGRSIDALIKVAQGHGDNEVVGFLMQFIEETGPISQNKTLPMGAAYGGRIGFNLVLSECCFRLCGPISDL